MTGDLDRLLERGESLCGEHRKVWPECASLHPEVAGDLPEVPQQPQRRNPMNPRDGLQDRGEPHRRRLGIDGTAADAQDVDHPYLADAPRGDWCVICGLSRSFRRHVDVGGS